MIVKFEAPRLFHDGPKTCTISNEDGTFYEEIPWDKKIEKLMGGKLIKFFDMEKSHMRIKKLEPVEDQSW